MLLFKLFVRGLREEFKRKNLQVQQDKELSELLWQFEQSDQEIHSEADLEPFYQYLRDRWQSMQMAGDMYSQDFATPAQQLCKTIASHLTIVANRFEYKPREMKKLLMPDVSCSMRIFVNDALDALAKIQAQTHGEHSPFVSLESQMALDELQSRLQAMSQSSEPVTWKNLSPIIDFLSARFKVIEGSRADYRLNAHTQANIFCSYLAKTVFNALKVNQDEVAVQNAEELLIPAGRALSSPSGTDHHLAEWVLNTLKAEEDLSEEKRIYTHKLKGVNGDLTVFAKRLLGELDALEKDDPQNMNLKVYLESKRAIDKARELLLRAQAAFPATVNGAAINPLIVFLRERWKLIADTPASDAKCQSAANRFCRILADHLALMAYQINYLNKNPQRLLNPPLVHDPDNKQQMHRLSQAIVENAKGRDAIVEELTSLGKSCWETYFADVDNALLINVFTNGKSDITDVSNEKSLFDKNEMRSKAILYWMFSTYLNYRAMNANDYTSRSGRVLSMFVPIPTGSQKKNAVSAVLRFLLSDASLADFDKTLNQPGSDLYPHKEILENGNLLGFINQIRTAAGKMHDCSQNADSSLHEPRVLSM